MPFRWVHRTLILWIATFAVLFSVVAPTISATLEAEGLPGLEMICTVDGARAAPSGESAERHDSVPSIDRLFEHCPYCSSHVAHLGMPPAVLTSPVLPLSFAEHRYHAAAAPTLQPWSDALSRAPPSLA